MKTKLASYDIQDVFSGLTVGELVAMLQKLPQDARLQTEQVCYPYDNYAYLHLNVIGESK